MNFGDMQVTVKRNLGNRTDIDDLIKQWINSTYLDLVTAGKFPEFERFSPIPVPELDAVDTFNTASGTPSYAYFQDMLFPISMRDTTNDRPLRQKSIQWYHRHQATTNQKPANYALFRRYMYIDPTPDGIYTVEVLFRKKLDIPVLTADAHEPVIGEEWHEGITIGATYRGQRSLNYPTMNQWKNDFKVFIISHSEQLSDEEEDVETGMSIEL